MNVVLKNSTCSRFSLAQDWQLKLVNEQHIKKVLPVFVFILITMIVGVVGNALVVIVHLTGKRKTLSGYYILALAAIDLFACLCLHPYVLVKMFNHYAQKNDVLCKAFEYLIHSSLAVSVVLLCTITIDRFLAVCRPYLYISNRSMTRFKLSIAISLGLGIISSLPMLHFNGRHVIILPGSDGKLSGFVCDGIDRYDGTRAQAVYIWSTLGCFIVACGMTGVMYGMVARVVCHIGQARNVHIKPLASTPTCTFIEDHTDDIFDTTTDNFRIGHSRGTITPLETPRASYASDTRQDVRNGGHNSSCSSPLSCGEVVFDYSLHNFMVDEQIKENGHAFKGKDSNKCIRNSCPSLNETGPGLVSGAATRRATFINTETRQIEGLKENGLALDTTKVIDIRNQKSKPDQKEAELIIDGAAHDVGNSFQDQIQLPRDQNPFCDSLTKCEPSQTPHNRPLSAQEPIATTSAHRPHDVPLEDNPDMATTRWTTEAPPIQTQRVKTARTLFVVTLVFLLSWCPLWVLIIARVIDTDFWIPKTDAEKMLDCFLRHVVFVNNAANPLIYAASSSQFRKQLKLIWSKKKDYLCDC